MSKPRRLHQRKRGEPYEPYVPGDHYLRDLTKSEFTSAPGYDGRMIYYENFQYIKRYGPDDQRHGDRLSNAFDGSQVYLKSVWPATNIDRGNGRGIHSEGGMRRNQKDKNDYNLGP